VTAPPAPAPTSTLAEEFSRRLLALEAAGEIVDPRAAQIDRLKAHVGELKERVAERNMQISELTEFKQRALSRIAAQHQEIERLRAQIGAGNKVTPLLRQPAPGTIGSCS
jgi:chromosome segregation ATPase